MSIITSTLLLMQTAMATMIRGDARVQEIPSKREIYLGEISIVDIEMSTWNLVVPYINQMKG